MQVLMQESMLEHCISLFQALVYRVLSLSDDAIVQEPSEYSVALLYKPSGAIKVVGHKLLAR